MSGWKKIAPVFLYKSSLLVGHQMIKKWDVQKGRSYINLNPSDWKKMMQMQYIWWDNCSRIIFFRSETFKLIYDLLFYTSHFLIIWGPARRLLLYKNTSWHCAKRMKENEMEKGSPTTSKVLQFRKKISCSLPYLLQKWDPYFE